MLLKNLELQNFRNLSGVFDFEDGMNIIIGPNGAGKTNLLESIFYLATGSSFRTSNDYAIVEDDNTIARISADFEVKGDNDQNLEVIFEKKSANSNSVKKTLKINQNATIRSKFVGNFYCIVFSPVTVDLVTSTPSTRRNDLDDFLCMVSPEFVEIIDNYKKVIRSRNKLLEQIREKKASIGELAYWSDSMIENGAKVIYQRANAVEKINDSMSEGIADLFNSGINKFDVFYVSKFINNSIDLTDISEDYRSKVADNLEKEIRAGYSLYGPHREDFEFRLNDKDASEYGSRGQQRLCAFLYKIAQWKLLSKRIGYDPALLLDDLFSELDEKVSARVQKFLDKSGGQIFLTSTTRGEIERKIYDNSNAMNL